MAAIRRSKLRRGNFLLPAGRAGHKGRGDGDDSSVTPTLRWGFMSTLLVSSEMQWGCWGFLWSPRCLWCLEDPQRTLAQVPKWLSLLSHVMTAALPRLWWAETWSCWFKAPKMQKLKEINWIIPFHCSEHLPAKPPSWEILLPGEKKKMIETLGLFSAQFLSPPLILPLQAEKQNLSTSIPPCCCYSSGAISALKGNPVSLSISPATRK